MPGRRKNKGENADSNGSGQPFYGAHEPGQQPYQGQAQGGYPPPQFNGQQGQPPQPPPGSMPYTQQPPAKKKGKLAKNGCLGCGGLLALIIIIVIIVVATNSSSGSGSSNTSAAVQPSGSVTHSTAGSHSTAASPASSAAKKQGSDVASKMDSTYGKFAPITRSGASTAIISLPASAKGGIIKATYSGSTNFIISGLDSNNQPTGDIGLPNAIGHYSGTTMFGDLDLGNKATKLKIEASGPWKVTVSPVSDAPRFPAAGASGTGDAVYLYTGGATTMNVTNKGSSNFIVSQVGEVLGGAQINEIGNYNGQAAFVGGTQPLTINSDGAWTIKPTN